MPVIPLVHGCALDEGADGRLWLVMLDRDQQPLALFDPHPGAVKALIALLREAEARRAGARGAG